MYKLGWEGDRYQSLTTLGQVGNFEQKTTLGPLNWGVAYH